MRICCTWRLSKLIACATVIQRSQLHGISISLHGLDTLISALILLSDANAVVVELPQSCLPIHTFILGIWPLHFVQRCVRMSACTIQLRLAFKTPVLQILGSGSRVGGHDFGISDVVEGLVIMVVYLLEVMYVVRVIYTLENIYL